MEGVGMLKQLIGQLQQLLDSSHSHSLIHHQHSSHHQQQHPRSPLSPSLRSVSSFFPQLGFSPSLPPLFLAQQDLFFYMIIIIYVHAIVVVSL